MTYLPRTESHLERTQCAHGRHHDHSLPIREKISAKYLYGFVFNVHNFVQCVAKCELGLIEKHIDLQA